MADDAPAAQPHPGDMPPTAAPPDPAVAVNFLPNANPITGVVVQMLRNVAEGTVELRTCRVRDAWLEPSGLPMVNLLVELGGDLRGGPNSALWHQIRSHPWYASDEDIERIPKHARVVFALRDQRVRATAAELATKVPKSAVDPAQKLQDSVDRHLKIADAVYPATVPAHEVRYLLASFVDACSRARTDP